MARSSAAFEIRRLDPAARAGVVALVRTWSQDALDAPNAPDRLVAAWGLTGLGAREVVADEQRRRRMAAK